MLKRIIQYTYIDGSSSVNRIISRWYFNQTLYIHRLNFKKMHFSKIQKLQDSKNYFMTKINTNLY